MKKGNNEPKKKGITMHNEKKKFSLFFENSYQNLQSREDAMKKFNFHYSQHPFFCVFLMPLEFRVSKLRGTAAIQMSDNNIWMKEL